MSIHIKDAYTWSVVYANGSTIAEYDHPGGRGFAEVGDLQVKQLILSPVDSLLHAHSVEIPPGATPVFFRRRRVAINLIDESTSPQATTHCIGWKRDGQAIYLFAGDDGSTLLTEDLQAI